MLGYATTRQLTESQSDTAEEPLGAPQPSRPWRAVAALGATALLVVAACSVTAGAGTGAVTPSAPGRRSGGVPRFVSKEEETAAKDDCSFRHKAGAQVSVEVETACAEALKKQLQTAESGSESESNYTKTNFALMLDVHDFDVTFDVNSTTVIDPARAGAAIGSVLEEAASAILGGKVPKNHSTSCIAATANTYHVDCHFTLQSGDEVKALWEACEGAEDPEKLVASKLTFIDNPTVSNVECAKNPVTW